jgi:hypothetical protein
LVSATLSAALPALESTFAVVEALYVFATPSVKVPNPGCGPSVSASVAGTVPVTVVEADGGTSAATDALAVSPSA